MYELNVLQHVLAIGCFGRLKAGRCTLLARRGSHGKRPASRPRHGLCPAQPAMTGVCSAWFAGLGDLQAHEAVAAVGIVLARSTLLFTKEGTASNKAGSQEGQCHSSTDGRNRSVDHRIARHDQVAYQANNDKSSYEVLHGKLLERALRRQGLPLTFPQPREASFSSLYMTERKFCCC